MFARHIAAVYADPVLLSEPISLVMKLLL
jgi:hypothetical protein